MAMSFLNKPYPKAQSVVSPNIGLNALSSTITPTPQTGNTDNILRAFSQLGSKIGNKIPGNTQPFKPNAPTTIEAPSATDKAIVGVNDYFKNNTFYDPSKDPLISQAQRTGQLSFDAGLNALQSTFGDQRRDVEGRIFKQGLSGSGIAEGIYGQQYSQENQAVGQLSADIAASTSGAVGDAMITGIDNYYRGFDNELKKAELIINSEIENGRLGVEEGKLAIEKLRLDADQRKNDIDEFRAITEFLRDTWADKGGGQDMWDAMILNIPEHLRYLMADWDIDEKNTLKQAQPPNPNDYQQLIGLDINGNPQYRTDPVAYRQAMNEYNRINKLRG